MQVKCEVFSRFGNTVDFSSGEPLGGVEASTVGADLCVRPSSPERSLFCGRTRRSAPTQTTSARQFHSSNAVTSICTDARCPYQGAARFALIHLIYIKRGDTQQWVPPLIVYRASIVLSCVRCLSSYVDALSMIAYSDDVAASGVVA